jgi:O-acetyl-ADP-ribose deacetylase (regulator of RNase III)
MLRFLQGNLLEARVEALVNAVNEVGVMGKGIALLFKTTFPENARLYIAACRRRELQVGRVLVTPVQRLQGPRWIVHFPTKKHWRHPSRLEWVRDGLCDLVREVRERGVRSIALPALGCGNGGLDWEEVRREMEIAFAGLADVDVQVFAPGPEPVGISEREAGQRTTARVLLAEMVRRYSVLGCECALAEVHELAWFLQRAIAEERLFDPLGLGFTVDRQGPRADTLRRVLAGLDGSFLHCERRMADARPFDRVWFDDRRRLEVDACLHGPEAGEYLPALERTAAVIAGFESSLGLELLATVDWLLCREGVEPLLAAVQDGIRRWPGGRVAGRRKQRLFDGRMLEAALRRLTEAQSADALRV